MPAAKFDPRDENPQSVMVWMKDIKVMPDQLQTRAETKKAVVEEYLKRMRVHPFDPILLYRLPDGRIVLADGFHRHAAAKQLRREKISSHVVDGTMEEALLAGLAANKAQLVRTLNESDKNHAVELMIRNETFRSWSDPEIARRTSVSNTMVRNARVRLRDKEGIPIPSHVVQFQDGVPTGRMVPYRQLKDDRRPSLQKAARTHFVIEAQERTHFGSGSDEAKDAFEKYQQLRETIRHSLKTAAAFRAALATRDMPCCSSGSSGDPVCVTVLDTRAVLISAYEFGVEFVLASGMKLLIASEKLSIKRKLIIGWSGPGAGESNASTALKQMESHGIEFMKWSDFIAEFGPKDGGEGGES